MRQVTVKKGNVLVEEVPAPVAGDNTLIIQVINSCISAGTELSGISHSGKSMLKRAIEQPEKVNKAIKYISNFGVQGFLDKIDQENSAKPTGYSVSGIIVEAGRNVKRFKPGDRVAAAGSGYANHSEFVEVPENLVVKIPETLDFSKASSVTLGAIALQGVRRTDLKLGEYCVVIGAGILGLLSVQMLTSSGVRVITIDRDQHRLDLAKEYGSELVINSSNIDSLKEVELVTGGHGADAVIFTAATSEPDVISGAFKMCKRKGKVVLVGVAGDTIKRDDMYMKELDYIISTSTGPGRYDGNYEEKGIDYPYDYVRWTENRNMSEYLRLIDKGLINIGKMINGVFKIQDAPTAFKSLTEVQPKPLIVILDYGNSSQSKTISRKTGISDVKTKQGIINVGVIGAGNFALGVHLPNLKKLKDKFHIRAIVSSKGLKAKQTAEQYGANYASTDYKEVLNDKDINLVMICTRHGNHGALTLEALKAGKNVFVEKPLAITNEELKKIEEFYSDDSTGKPVLMVGFNRRFSKYAKEIKKHTDTRTNPLFVTYRINAGYAPSNSWIHEDGGRVIGEVCHFIDLMSYLTGAKIDSFANLNLSPSDSSKFNPDDNTSIILKYTDGSVCNINYVSSGNKSLPKEYIEIHFDEKSIVLDDFKSIKGYGITVNEITTSAPDKGHLEELDMLYDTLSCKSKNMPIELWDMFQTTELSFKLSG